MTGASDLELPSLNSTEKVEKLFLPSWFSYKAFQNYFPFIKITFEAWEIFMLKHDVWRITIFAIKGEK